ncbi:MAG: hypothetical protein JKY20_12100 [Alphaproteobacteria bacterium]|nr:hypothetical protein [Alphaproteobacteria bacterium]
MRSRGLNRPPSFGSFNNLSKINARVIALWAKVLRAAPESRLVLKSRQLDDDRVAEGVRVKFEEHGVTSDRLTLLGRMASTEGHLALYGEVDVALDPFPYNGATTTCEALWMGVPVVSLIGDRHVGRFGVGFLHRAEFPEWAVATEDDYVDVAVRLLSERPSRDALRAKVDGSSLLDSALFVGELENLYRDVWQRYCAGR